MLSLAHARIDHRRNRAGRAAIAARLERDGWPVLAAGRADGDLGAARAGSGARRAGGRGARRARPARLRRRRGLRAQAGRGGRRGRLGRGLRRHGEGQLLRLAGRRAAPARIARLHRDDRGRRRLPALAVVRGALRRPRRRRRCSRACSRARSRPRCASAGSRPGPSRSSPARRSGAPRRRCSAGSARPTTSPTRSLYLAGAQFVTGATLVVDGGRSAQIRRGFATVETMRWSLRSTRSPLAARTGSSDDARGGSRRR